MPGNVPPGAADGGRVDVDGVDFGVVYDRGERGADRARAAAQVDDDGAGPGEGPRGGRGDGTPPDEKKSLLDEELGAAARHEDPGIHGDAQPAELGPAEDLLERQAGGPPLHHRVEFLRAAGRGDEQRGFVLGEDAARGPEPGDDGSFSHAVRDGCEGRRPGSRTSGSRAARARSLGPAAGSTAYRGPARPG